MSAQKFNCGGGILDSLRFIQALIKRESLLPFRFRLIGHIDAAFLAPKQIGTNRHEAMRRIPVADLPHVLIDAKDFLQDDDAWPITAGRQSDMRVKFAAIKRFDCEHESLRAKRYTRISGDLATAPLATHVPLDITQQSCTCGSALPAAGGTDRRRAWRRGMQAHSSLGGLHWRRFPDQAATNPA